MRGITKRCSLGIQVFVRSKYLAPVESVGMETDPRSDTKSRVERVNVLDDCEVVEASIPADTLGLNDCGDNERM